jgi:hypothetical protein
MACAGGVRLYGRSALRPYNTAPRPACCRLWPDHLRNLQMLAPYASMSRDVVVVLEVVGELLDLDVGKAGVGEHLER